MLVQKIKQEKVLVCLNKKNGTSYYYYYCNDCELTIKGKTIEDVISNLMDEIVKQVHNTNREYKRIQKLSVTLEEMDSNLFRSEQQIAHLTMTNFYLESESISLNRKLKEQEITIDNLKDENKTLSSKLKYFKNMFYNLVR